MLYSAIDLMVKLVGYFSLGIVMILAGYTFLRVGSYAILKTKQQLSRERSGKDGKI